MELERTISAAWAPTLAGAADPEEDGELAAGDRLGRYVIVGVLGQGGMGVVYAGHDPELDRRVALKLLFGADGAEARLRTLREAQALARLQHPNVVAIHDVGTADERVWLAMEHVQGVTLRQWLAQAERGWRTALEVMLAAARGLAAAHAAGLVHRDVKPENIMIGDDGRVRVMDFGVARAGAVNVVPPTGSGPSLLGSSLTLVGSLIGTPVYMAPEGLAGAAIDARADIFSWCVTCWEALFGRRPYTGETLEELRRNVGLGKLQAPPTRRKVPAGVRRALERGLAVDPARRFGSIERLLAAIDAALRGQRRRLIGAACVAATIVVAGAAGGRTVQARATAARCDGEGAAIAAVWSDEAAGRVEAAFVATGRADAPEVFARTRPWLDAYATSWAESRAALCLAGEAGEAVDDGVACLDEREAGFAALIEVLSRADAATMDRGVGAASRLTPLAPCRDRAWLAHAPRRPDDAETRRRIAGVRATVERSLSFERAGEFDDAAALAMSALAEAEALAWPPLTAEVRLHEAGFKILRAEFAAAEAALEQVVWQAEAIGYDALVAEASHDLTYAVGMGLGRPAEGLRWGRLGVAALTRIGAEEGLPATNNYAALGIVQETRGELDEAQALKEKVLALRERHLGPDHPSVGSALSMMGALYVERDDPDAALRAHERALAIRVKALGPDHYEVATSRINLGVAHALRGEAAACLEQERAAQHRITAIHGPSHPDLATALENAATCELDLGELAAALADYRGSLAIRERVLGPQHPLVGVSQLGVGDVLLAQGDVAGAAAVHAAGLKILEASLGADHSNVAEALLRLATSRRADAPDEARALLERAHGIRRARALSTRATAAIDAALVRALWDAGDADSRARARSLLAEATDELRRARRFGPYDPLRELDEWFAAHAAELRG